MKKLTLPDDHDLCIRTFLTELQSLGLPRSGKGVLHIGAHMGEEVPAYLDHAYAPIYLVEANPEILPALESKFEHEAQVHVIGEAVGAAEGTVEFVVHQTAKGSMESSSLLALERLGEIVPVFNSERCHRVPMTTVDLLARRFDLESRIGLMVLDIQGAERLALQGAGNFLKHVEAVICEVNLIQNYEGCALEAEIDEIFKSAGYVKQLAIYHELYDEKGRFPAWGECLWRREDALTSG
jgi:FkbM family methyltransferase